ncbi:MAG: drrA 2 [Rickettsiaceae bacterium]|jgi:ABC-2 type transport system ATP-binding protein|nr:drrA 2 [Rickettsiaceae bacterium]
MLAVKLENLTKKYAATAKAKEKLALDNVSLEVPEGSFFALLGPNGAGKSSLINILAGTVNKTSGKASIMGVDIDENTQAAKSLIGVVPQELVMDTFFPISEALELYAGYYGVPKKQRRTEEIIKALGLYDKRNNTAKQLSGGMKRRFLVAKAMVHSPKVLILDEPTAGVDIELREQLWDYVLELNQKGTTIILTTHYLEEAEKLCDRIAFINHGRIIKEDTKENLLTSLGSRELDIEFDEEIESVPENIKEYDYKIIDKNKLKVRFQSNRTSLGQVLYKIQKSGLNIKDLSTHQADLQDIFKKVMQS